MSAFQDVIEIDAPLLSGDWTSVGSRHHVTNRVGGTVIDSVHEITHFEPPRILEERITARGTTMVATSEVRPIGHDRSLLIVRAEIAGAAASSSWSRGSCHR